MTTWQGWPASSSGAPWTDLEPRHNLIANNPLVNTDTTSPPSTGQRTGQ